jgi:hypothetical protein
MTKNIRKASKLNRTKLTRAAAGTASGTSFVLRMPPDLRTACTKTATKYGLSESEFWRKIGTYAVTGKIPAKVFTASAVTNGN